ncbi:MAG: ABC transporter permease [Candidatus Omnitrophota bacterium]
MKIVTLFVTHQNILWNLVNKNLRIKYAGSVLGMLWAFINPLLLALIISFVFTNIFKVSSEDFYLFILSGMLPWTFFSGALQESALSIPVNAAVLKQFPLPREIIPVSVVLVNFIIFLLGLIAVSPLFIMIYPAIVFRLPLLLAALVLLFLFTLGFSLLLSAVCVHFRDITHILNTFLTFWLWLTPIFYFPDIIPDKYRIIVAANPFQPYLVLFRGALLERSLWSIHVLLTGILFSLLALGIGAWVFFNKKDSFIQRI